MDFSLRLVFAGKGLITGAQPWQVPSGYRFIYTLRRALSQKNAIFFQAKIHFASQACPARWIQKSEVLCPDDEGSQNGGGVWLAKSGNAFQPLLSWLRCPHKLCPRRHIPSTSTAKLIHRKRTERGFSFKEWALKSISPRHRYTNLTALNQFIEIFVRKMLRTSRIAT
jgi:hypothetical protein